MNNNTKKENVGSQEEKDIESNLTALGEHIVERRHEKKLSQKALASLIKVTPVYMCRIESGKQIPSKDCLKQISAYIGTPYDRLLALAGYNDLSPKWELYATDGNALDPKSIVDSIYKIDSDLLGFFENFEEIGTPDNIQVLKILLLAMRKEVSIKGLGKSKVSPTDKIFKESFFSLKNFITSLLMPMVTYRAK
jgi:transcriptional regulator with XRE-family HTH domain